jgi:hypothetical protein
MFAMVLFVLGPILEGKSHFTLTVAARDDTLGAMIFEVTPQVTPHNILPTLAMNHAKVACILLMIFLAIFGHTLAPVCVPTTLYSAFGTMMLMVLCPILKRTFPIAKLEASYSTPQTSAFVLENFTKRNCFPAIIRALYGPHLALLCAVDV